MAIDNRIKHTLHCSLYLLIILWVEVYEDGICISSNCTKERMDPYEEYGSIPTIVFYLLKFLPLLCLAESLFHFFGLVLFNAFPEKVHLKSSPSEAPFMSIRVVTRGDFPELVTRNVERNMNMCSEVGLKNFIFEVVTEKDLNLQKYHRIREIVVPSTYKTRSGAKFKALALQYCLEEDVNILSDSDWIVHLDEETIMTEDSLRGIINFVSDGKHEFGQGLITYANESVINWITTLADSFRVSRDLGNLRMQFKMCHGLYFLWKGSFIVSHMFAEKDVSFDHGPDGSILEDNFFGLLACSKGYSFNFIEGEMWEKSPFTFWDFINQRRRWIQGASLIAHSSYIPIFNRLSVFCAFYFFVTSPLNIANLFIEKLYPVPCWQSVNFLIAFMKATLLYVYIFGIIKTFNFPKLGPLKWCFCIIIAILAIPVYLFLETIALIYFYFTFKKHEFYVVNKIYKADTS